MKLTPGALHGLRVIDLTTVIMGPFATATLADMGADVIKVESLDGDMSRDVGARRHDGMSALTLNLQRNKRSIAIDLASAEGREILDDLVRNADVLVTNLRPRSRQKLGITYERLSEVNPGLILCTARRTAPRPPSGTTPPMTTSCKPRPAPRNSRNSSTENLVMPHTSSPTRSSDSPPTASMRWPMHPS